jgi:hypothetical protein
VNWSFKGRTRVYVEHIGELSPSAGNGESAPVIKGPGPGEVPAPKGTKKKSTSDAKQP